MKSLHTKILTLLLSFVLACTLLIGGAGVISAGRVVREDSAQIMNLTCVEKAQEIDEKLRAIEQSVKILYGYADTRFTEEESLWSKQEYLDEYTSQMNTVFESAVKNTEQAVAVYIRFNPEIFEPTAGIFLEKEEETGDFRKLEPTDMSLYEPDDISRVGWYYVPVANGGPTWMEPYENKNLGITMISYIIPMYKNGVTVGVIGMDIDIRLLRDSVSAVSVYDTGYAVLFGENQDIIYHKDYPNGIQTEEFDEKLRAISESMSDGSQLGKVTDYEWKTERKRFVSHRLLNGMSLAIVVPASELDKEKNILFWQCACLFILIMLLAVLSSAKLIKQMTKPLQELTRAAKQVAGGNWNVRVECDSKDEIGVLAQTLKGTVEELNRTHRELENLASTDALTGLYNRHYMKEYCQNYVKGAKQDVGVVFCDLNGLKFANDHYGHTDGDALLLNFARVIRNCFPQDVCFRMGGDEFVVIVLQKTKEQFLEQVEALQKANRKEEPPLSAIGFYYQYEAENLGHMLTKAEDAMYQDKEKFYKEFPMYQR